MRVGPPPSAVDKIVFPVQWKFFRFVEVDDVNVFQPVLELGKVSQHASAAGVGTKCPIVVGDQNQEGGHSVSVQLPQQSEQEPAFISGIFAVFLAPEVSFLFGDHGARFMGRADVFLKSGEVHDPMSLAGGKKSIPVINDRFNKIFHFLLM